MENEKSRIPFGLLFEELARPPHDLVIPTYDEGADLSYVEDSNGRRIPYVEFDLAGTHTETRVWRETIDTDPQDDHQRCSLSRRSLISTDTLTKVARETTDKD